MTENLSVATILATQRQALQTHPLAQASLSLNAWRMFMQVHVFAVFDFMSLLKRLQRELTCVTLPWQPPAHPELARLINEMVLGEETDVDHLGRHRSHFEMYLEAMASVGADTAPIRGFVALLQQGLPWREALEQADVPLCAKPFVQRTLACALEGRVHEVAAAFFYGREDILPQLFANLQASLDSDEPRLAPLKRYFIRHIELDGDHHGPMAERMLDILCAGEAERAAEAQATALAALGARRQLWDGVLATLD